MNAFGSIPTIPAPYVAPGWSFRPLKFNLRKLSEKTGSRSNVLALENIESWTGRLQSSGSEFDGDGVKFRKGDILFGKLRPYLAKVHQVKTDGEAIGDLWVLRPSNDCNATFLTYQLLNRDFIEIVDASTNGAKMPRAEWAFVSSIGLPTPPLKDQTVIANFLDQQTAQIDGLIDKKTQFIALLREKRTAAIAHAVTKGIGKNTPMKSSGEDWLGDIPAHWSVCPPTVLFSESKERARETDPLLSATQKYGVIPVAEFEALEQRKVTMAVVNLDKRKHVEVGDFVISMRSMDGGLESARAVGSVRSSYSVLKCGPDVDGRFFGFLLKSDLYIQALRLTSSFIRDGQDMNFGHFRKVRLPVIPIVEQSQIADHLEEQMMRIDMLVTKTNRSIELLKEKRAALITAAVTGKIDVRSAA
ncbi:MAG: restriction endonuclease subunit S [Sulfitobacter sp.]